MDNKMTQIFSDPNNTSHEVIKETVDDPDLSFQQAEALAKKIAQKKMHKLHDSVLEKWKDRRILPRP